MKSKVSYFSFLSTLTVVIFSCSNKPDICDCMNKAIDINQQLDSAKGNYAQIRNINQNSSEMESCNEMFNELSSSEKEEMKDKVKGCSNYSAFMKLFK